MENPLFELREIVFNLLKFGNRKLIISVLKSFGVSRVTELRPYQIGAATIAFKSLQWKHQ